MYLEAPQDLQCSEETRLLTASRDVCISQTRTKYAIISKGLGDLYTGTIVLHKRAECLQRPSCLPSLKQSRHISSCSAFLFCKRSLTFKSSSLYQVFCSVKPWSSPTSSYSFCKVVITSFESLQGIKDALVDA